MPDPRTARSRRPGRLTALVTALVAAVTVASGCSVIPSGNGAQPASAPGPPAGAGPCCGLLVRSPQVGWSAQEVVKYFLLASAIVAHNYQVARQYLMKPAIESWHPGASVTILAKEPEVSYQGGRGITGHGGQAERAGDRPGTGQAEQHRAVHPGPGRGAGAHGRVHDQGRQKGHPQDRRTTVRRRQGLRRSCC